MVFVVGYSYSPLSPGGALNISALKWSGMSTLFCSWDEWDFLEEKVSSTQKAERINFCLTNEFECIIFILSNSKFFC